LNRKQKTGEQNSTRDMMRRNDPRRIASSEWTGTYIFNNKTPRLLSRIRDRCDHSAWRELDARYRDLLMKFCRRRGVPNAGAEHLVQAVFADLSRSLPQFTYQRDRGRFRDLDVSEFVHAGAGFMRAQSCVGRIAYSVHLPFG
jgi:hypothetical protein